MSIQLCYACAHVSNMKELTNKWGVCWISFYTKVWKWDLPACMSVLITCLCIIKLHQNNQSSILPWAHTCIHVCSSAAYNNYVTRIKFTIFPHAAFSEYGEFDEDAMPDVTEDSDMVVDKTELHSRRVAQTKHLARQRYMWQNYCTVA